MRVGVVVVYIKSGRFLYKIRLRKKPPWRLNGRVLSNIFAFGKILVDLRVETIFTIQYPLHF